MDRLTPYPETELLRMTADGDEEAFRHLYDSYRDKIYSYAVGLSKTEALAEDTVQEVFLKLWTNRNKLAEVENFPAYITTLARNQMVSQFRKQASQESFIRAMIKEGELRVNKHVSDTALYNELKNILAKAMDSLTSRQRKIYELGQLEGYSYEEIGRLLNVSQETVKAHMKAALRSMRLFLKKYKELIVLIFCLLMEK